MQIGRENMAFERDWAYIAVITIGINIPAV